MIYYFNRYIGGVMMAEAACVVKASSFAGALRVAISLFRDCPGSVFQWRKPCRRGAPVVSTDFCCTSIKTPMSTLP